MELGRAEHVARRVESHPPVPAAHLLAEPEHPPAARAPCLRDQRKRLGREESLLVPASVVCVRVGDEREAADRQWVEPQPMPRQGDPVIPDNLAVHSGISSPCAKRSEGTLMPTAA